MLAYRPVSFGLLGAVAARFGETALRRGVGGFVKQPFRTTRLASTAALTASAAASSAPCPCARHDILSLVPSPARLGVSPKARKLASRPERALRRPLRRSPRRAGLGRGGLGASGGGNDRPSAWLARLPRPPRRHGRPRSQTKAARPEVERRRNRGLVKCHRNRIPPRAIRPRPPRVAPRSRVPTSPVRARSRPCARRGAARRRRPRRVRRR